MVLFYIVRLLKQNKNTYKIDRVIEEDEVEIISSDTDRPNHSL